MAVSSGVASASVWHNVAAARVEWRTTLDDGTEIQLHLYTDPLKLGVVRRFPGGSWESLMLP